MCKGTCLGLILNCVVYFGQKDHYDKILNMDLTVFLIELDDPTDTFASICAIDKLKLTGLKQHRVFNYRCGRASI